MLHIVQHSLKCSHTFGEEIDTAQFKKDFPYKVANTLKDGCYERWEDMEFKHTKRHDYSMFKSLIDLCNRELALKLEQINEKQSGEKLTQGSAVITRSKKEANVLGEQFTQGSTKKNSNIELKEPT